MKKIYLLAVAKIFAATSFAQVSEQGNSYVKETKAVNGVLANTKAATDTAGWVPNPSKWLPGEFAVGGQVWNFGYTGGGYVYGVNISANDINHCAQGYLNLNTATFGVEGVVFAMVGKDEISAGSNIGIELWSMAANSAFSYDGAAWNQDAVGPNTMIASTTLPLANADTTWFTLVWAPFASVQTISGTDFAVTIDGTACKAANDTIGIACDADGEGFRLAFHRVGVASNNWYITDDLFGGLDNNIAIFPVIDDNFVGINDVEFYNGIQMSVYPNPIADQATITYNLEENMNSVKVVVFDMTGKEVMNQNFGAQAQGTYNVSFDASNLNAGNYFYSVVANGHRLTKRMVVTK